MKKQAVCFWGAVLGIIVFTTVAFAADKFGYVNVDAVAKEYGKAKDYTKTLEGKEAAYNSDIEKKANEVKQYQDKLNLLSDKEKAAKKNEFEDKLKAFDEFVRQKQTDLRKEYIEKKIEIAKDIRDAVTQLAEKEGYTFIFDGATLIYQPKGLDLTDRIIAILNSKPRK
jgi:Skp family chaperone for outer membrane proteins